MGVQTSIAADASGMTGISRVLLKDEAYVGLKQFLLETEGTDQALSERGLAARLGLGLGSVRSALERLRAEGLIAVSPNSGIRMSEVDARGIVEFYEFRLVVEAYVVANLAGRLSEKQRDGLERVIADQELAAREGDTVSYHRLDLDFHAMLAEFHGNAEMVHAMRRLRDRMYRLSRRMHRAHPERLAPNAAQHRLIMEAVRDGDPVRARSEMERHLEWGRSFTLDPDGRIRPRA